MKLASLENAVTAFAIIFSHSIPLKTKTRANFERLIPANLSSTIVA